MYSARKRKGKNKKKASPKQQTTGEIQRYFSSTHEASPATKMVDPTRFVHHEGLPFRIPLILQRPRVLQAGFDTPAVFRSDPQGSQNLPLTLRADAELRVLLQALPTRSDIEALIGKFEASNCKELMVVKKSVKVLSDWMESGGSSWQLCRNGCLWWRPNRHRRQLRYSPNSSSLKNLKIAAGETIYG